MSLISAEVSALVCALLKLPDSALRQAWHGTRQDPAWQDYSDNLSDVTFSFYQQLRSFAVTVQSKRAKHGPPVTSAHLILGQHQVAYRDFHGVLAGINDDELDLTPFAMKWSLRMNIAHLMIAECCSQGPKIRQALDQERIGSDTSSPARDCLNNRAMPEDYGSLIDVLGRFDRCHEDLVEFLADATDEELDARSAYWEDEPVSVRFRLERFAWHLRSHGIQVDRIRAAIGHVMTDMDRLARLLYNALGEAEGSLIGVGTNRLELEKSIAPALNVRVKEIEALINSSQVLRCRQAVFPLSSRGG